MNVIEQIVNDIITKDSFLDDIAKSIIENDIGKAFKMPGLPHMPGAGAAAKPPSPYQGAGGGGAAGRSHKYVKRDDNFFGPGKHRYWYKLPDGTLTASKTPEEKDATKQPKREDVAPEKLQRDKEHIKDTAQQLLEEVSTRLAKPSNKEFEFEGKKTNESDFNYNMRLVSNALDYVDDFREKLLHAPTATPQAEAMKKDIYDNLIKNLHQQLQMKSNRFKDYSGKNGIGGETSAKEAQQPMSLEQQKGKLLGLSEKGISNLNSNEFKEYQKLKRDVSRQETAEITEISESQEKQLQQDRLDKSKDFVQNFEKIVKPVTDIKKPVVDDAVIAEFRKGENGPQAISGPSKLSAQKLNVVNTLRSTFKQLGLHPKGKISALELKKLASIDKVLIGGAAVSISLNTPSSVSKNDIKKIADALQRKYGSDVNIKYKPGNITEFEFAKRNVDDIVQPTLATGIDAINKELQAKSKEGQPRPAIINLGFDAKGQPINIDFSEGNSNSIAIVAGPGQGKSFSVESSLMQMTSIYSPEELQIDMIDTQGVFGSTLQKGAQKYLSNEPAMGIKTKDDVKKVIDLLENNVQEIENRNQVLKKYGIDNWNNLPGKSGNRQFATKIMVFDEFNSAFDKIDDAYAGDEQGAKVAKTLIQAKMKSIMNMGRKVGVVPITMGQMVDDNTKDIFGKAQAKIMYSADASTARNFLGKGGTEASRNLVAKGQSVVDRSGTRTYGVAVRRSDAVNNTYVNEVGKR